MKNLNNSSFKLWCYLNKNQEHYHFELSQKACEEWGIKKDSYYSAVKDLINKGYLIRKNENSNIYSFYEMPFSENPKEWFNDDEITISENPKNNSEKQNAASESQNINSEKTQRNNTNNTSNNTSKTKEKKRKTNLNEHSKQLIAIIETDYEKDKLDKLGDSLYLDMVKYFINEQAMYKETTEYLYDYIINVYKQIYDTDNIPKYKQENG